MPGVGVTDARQILERVALQRDAVWLSTALQLLSAACFAPAVIALGRIGRERGRARDRVGRRAARDRRDGLGRRRDLPSARVLHDGAGHRRRRDAAVDGAHAGPGLALLAPMVLAFFVGAATLAVGCWRAGLVGGAQPVAARGGGRRRASPGRSSCVSTRSLARVVGLTVLLLVSASLAGIGRALGPALSRASARARDGRRADRGRRRRRSSPASAPRSSCCARSDAAGSAFETKMWVVD